MTKELSADYTQNIVTAHNACLEIAAGMEERQIQFVNAVRECGIAIDTAKDALGHGGFVKWCTDNLPFSHKSVNRYMAVARELKSSPVTNLAEARAVMDKCYYATNTLEEPHREGQQQRHELGWRGKVTDLVMRFNGLFSKRPVEQLTQDEREAEKVELKPIVDRYGQL